MLEPTIIEEKSFNRETHRYIAELQLHLYGAFLEKFNNKIFALLENLPNDYNIRSKPITLQNEIFEDVTLLQLVQSDNKLLSRILISLGSLCEEFNFLIEEVYKTYYVSFTFCSEENDKDKEDFTYVSKLVEKLQQVNFFVNRVQKVIILLLRQLSALLGKNLYNGSSSTCFPEPLDHLAELLVCLVVLDNVCGIVLQNHWPSYRRAVKSMLHNPSQFQIPLEQIQSLDKCLSDIECKLLNGNILQQTMEKCLEEGLVIVMKNCSLGNEFLLFIQQMLIELERDEDNISFTQIWLQVNVMFVFYYYLFGNQDRKILKRLCDVNKKTVGCTLLGNIVWYPEAFLLQHIPSFTKYIDVKFLANNRLTQIAARSQNLPKESYFLCVQAYTWIINILNLTKKDKWGLKLADLQKACDLLIDGIKLLKKISEIVKWVTNLHADEGRPMAKSISLALCRLMEVLKAVQFVFRKNLLSLIYIISLILQYLTHKALTLINNIKKSLTQEKSYKEQQLDVLSSLNIAEHALKGPNTNRRILIAKLALSASGLSSETLSEIRSVINRLELMCNIHSLLNKLCNCSFLYWHQVLLPIYFNKFIDTKENLSRIYLLFNSLSDCESISQDKVSGNSEIYFKNCITSPLNQLVETNIRLQTHLHLKLPPSDPFHKNPPSTFKNIIPARFSKKYLHIKAELEHYLSAMFYNLTTVVLHDWRTYGEMRQLALLQYGLNTVEDNLPMQTLEQGLDVLEIMRNINIFVGKYMYNLNNQVFVEERSNNKHLNTINISHVANSIRTHGIGIMNTTVNFTYQFLQNKFYIFSQFMFDEQIKSRLLKDLRFFSEHKNELNQMYPYERAEKFNSGIKRLGLNSEGSSYLDLFRKLITHIGNAMGYVRMIRSGGRRCLADATCFIPDLKTVSELNELLESENLTESTAKVMNCFKQDLNNLVDNFEEATEYFKLLLNVFTPVLQNPQNVHLKNFYIIIPPLTINFVEHIFISKERLHKKNHSGAAFTDDGFAMGLAYIVELLNQSSQLKSLHWFHSIKLKHTQDRKNLEAEKAVASKEDEKLQQTLLLTEKRLNAFEKEFQLLYYCFNSAKIFFQS